MQGNRGTYTYTARNAHDPTKVVTFTLQNGRMRVNLTDVMEQVGAVAGAEDKPSELEQQLSPQIKPAALKIVENFAGAAHVSDVDAKLFDDRLKVTLWQRVAGLRLAPVQFNMGEIDNVDAAEAFVDELDLRKDRAQYLSRYFGPLDYWAGWAGLLILAGVLLSWLRRRDEHEQS